MTPRRAGHSLWGPGPPGRRHHRGVHDREVPAHLGGAAEVEVVVLGPSVPTEAAAPSPRPLRIPHPGLGVVLVRQDVDGATLATAMRAGVRDVVALEDDHAVVTAAQRACALAESWARRPAAATGPTDVAARDGRGQVVTVFSLKGGVGKSMVATNLATLLADAGRTVLPGRPRRRRR